MVPLLAPLLGSLAGSMLPATLGTGIAGALGLGGTAAGGLIAAAAPKAIGAGIGTLLGGGDLGDAALNAVGFGAAGAGAAALGGAAAPAATAAGTTGAAAAPTTGFNFQKAMQGMNAINSANKSAPVAAPPPPNLQLPQQNKASAQANPMLTAPGSAVNPAISGAFNNIIPSVGGPSAMPASVGLGSLKPYGESLDNTNMMAGLAPGQQQMLSNLFADPSRTGFS
mgnify:FL=1